MILLYIGVDGACMYILQTLNGICIDKGSLPAHLYAKCRFDIVSPSLGSDNKHDKFTHSLYQFLKNDAKLITRIQFGNQSYTFFLQNIK